MLEWEKRLTAITERLVAKDRFNLKQLYYTLSTTASDWIKNNQYGIKDGDVFIVERRAGAKYYFVFHEENTILNMLSFQYEPLCIVEEDDLKHGYHIMELYEFFMTSDRSGLGMPCHWSFGEILYEMKPGDVITFEGKNTYYCMQISGTKCKLARIYTGDITRINDNSFKNMETVNFSRFQEDDTLELYGVNRINMSGVIVPKYTTGKYIDEYIEGIKNSMAPGEKREYKFGNIDVIVKRKRFEWRQKPCYIWRAGDQLVFEKYIRVMMGYFNNAPLEMSIEREERDELTDFYDMECFTRTKDYGFNENYRGVYREIVNYVTKNKGKVSINLKTFEPMGEGNYILVCFDFKYEEGQVMVQKKYNDKNELNKKVNLEEFVEFCNNINKNNKIFRCEIGSRETMDEQIKLAEQIATHAHEGQVDKAGVEYINHPRTVSSMCETKEGKIVGWLHDVVEDTDVTLEELSERGFSDRVIEALRCVTKEDGYDVSVYYTRIKNNPIAREVKIADLTHNSDFSRIPDNAPEELKAKMRAKHKKYAWYKAYLLDDAEGKTLEEYLNGFKSN